MFSYAILSILFLRFVMATSRRSHSTAKSLKCVTAGGLEGTWDTKCHCISLDLPIGVTSIKMIVEGLDGVHTMDFSSFKCSTSFVQWKDYDYPWSSLDFLLAREARQQANRTTGVRTLFGLKIQPDCPSFTAANDHGAVAHTLLQSSGMHQTVSCRDLIAPSLTRPPPAAGGRCLSWGLGWPSPRAAPDLTRAPAPLHALPLPSALTPLPPHPPGILCPSSRSTFTPVGH